MDTQEKRIAYPATLIERVATYLATKPYREVYELLDELQKSGKLLDATKALTDE